MKTKMRTVAKATLVVMGLALSAGIPSFGGGIPASSAISANVAIAPINRDVAIVVCAPSSAMFTVVAFSSTSTAVTITAGQDCATALASLLSSSFFLRNTDELPSIPVGNMAMTMTMTPSTSATATPTVTTSTSSSSALAYTFIKR